MDAGDRTHPLCEGSYLGIVSVWAPLGSRSSVIFDLDDDGDLDIVTNDMNSAPLVLVSDLAQRTQLSFVKIRLRGTKSNRDGLGSLVRVHAGGRTQLKVHDGQSGYMSQSSQLLYFGLDKAKSIDRVEILWPSGKQQVVEAPKSLNQVLEIEER